MTKHKLLLLTAVVLLVFSGIAGAGATESHITTVADLQAIQNDLGGTYYLDSDLDLSGVSFTPLGNESTPFTGTFEGNGHAITYLTLNPESGTGVGMFACSNGTIRNLILKNISITSTCADYVGGLVGWNKPAGIISGITVMKSAVLGFRSSDHVSEDYGLIAGRNDGSITQSSVQYGTVEAVYSSGGIAGKNRGTIMDCSVDSCMIHCGMHGGGITGSGAEQGSVINCCVMNTTVTGRTTLGAIAGLSIATSDVWVTIRNTTAIDCTICGVPDPARPDLSVENIGGFAGTHGWGCIENCTISGTIVEGSKGTGGFVGTNGKGASICSSHVFTATVISKGTDSKMIGGFVGYNKGLITASTASGDVFGSSHVGGFAGYNTGTLTSCTSTEKIQVSTTKKSNHYDCSVTLSNVTLNFSVYDYYLNANDPDPDKKDTEIWFSANTDDRNRGKPGNTVFTFNLSTKNLTITDPDILARDISAGNAMMINLDGFNSLNDPTWRGHEVWLDGNHPEKSSCRHPLQEGTTHRISIHCWTWSGTENGRPFEHSCCVGIMKSDAAQYRQQHLVQSTIDVGTERYLADAIQKPTAVSRTDYDSVDAYMTAIIGC